MRISEETVDRVRSATDIVALVGEHVRLTKSGRSFKGLCPFHTEKTPSFMVNPEKQTYHCFGCGAGGNAISFLIEYAKMAFPEAVRYLGERAGIEIVATGDASRESDTGRLLEALAWAAAFFRARLEHPNGGRPARDYLARRGLEPDLAQTFGLGFAPAGWSHLLDEASKRFTPDILLRAGLIIARDGGGHYDRFRNRLMIPVTNHMGKVVGFGGRSIDPADEPKYLNSPESAVYQKGQILFGLSQAREAIHAADEVIVVEGYLDHFRVFGAGFRNVVAVAGTAFTSHQAGLLKRFAGRAVFVFDGDTAGATASWRAVAPSLAAGLDVRLAALPSGHDPDSLIRDKGMEAFRTVLSGALDPVEFAAVRLVPERGQVEAVKAVAEALKPCPDTIKRRILVKNAADRLLFDEAELLKVVEMGRTAEIRVPSAVLSPESRPDQVERELIAFLLAHPEQVSAAKTLQGNDFRHPLCRDVFQALLEDPVPGQWANRIMETEPASRLARFVSQLLVEPTDAITRLKPHVDKMLYRVLDEQMADLNRKLKAAEATNNEEEKLSLLKSKMDIKRQMTTLQKSTLMTGAKSDHD